MAPALRRQATPVSAGSFQVRGPNLFIRLSIPAAANALYNIV